MDGGATVVASTGFLESEFGRIAAALFDGLNLAGDRDRVRVAKMGRLLRGGEQEGSISPRKAARGLLMGIEKWSCRLLSKLTS